MTRVIVLGSDHAGFECKETIKHYLVSEGHAVQDEGTGSTESCDYPDIAKKVAILVQQVRETVGILVCGTGIGMSMAANRFERVRAAVCATPISAKLSREHNDANILCLGARMLTHDEAINIVETFLNTSFSGDERHVRRIKKIERDR